MLAIAAAHPAAGAPADASLSPGAGPGYAEADRAYKAVQHGDLAEAVAHAKAAVAAEPANRNYRRLLVSALFQAGRNDEADAAADAAEAQLGPDAEILAQRGYAATRRGRPNEAVGYFAKALSLRQLAPAQERDLRLNLADVALQAGQPAQALEALAPLADEASFAVQSRRAFAYAALNRTAEAEAAFDAAWRLGAQPADRAAMARGKIYSLVLLKRLSEAREAFRLADQQGLMAVAAPGDAAMLAVAVGEDARAQELFALAATRGELTPPRMTLDAGYGALRLGRNQTAAADFRLALGAADRGDLKLPPATIYQLRRQVTDLSRRWGGTIAAFYGEDGVSSAVLVGGRSIAQVGFEGYVRPALSGPASQVRLFLRAFQTVDAGSRQVDTGWKTAQGWVGVSDKPIPGQNLVLEGSRMVRLGARARDDWMLRAAYSAGGGLDLRPGQDAWPLWQVYAEAAQILDLRETLLYGDLRAGRVFVVPNTGGLLVGPFVGATYAYDNKQARANALAMGPGLVLRRWFGGSRYEAPGSYVESVVQYRFKVDGDSRLNGVFATISYGF